MNKRKNKVVEMYKEKRRVATAMVDHGGSFIYALGKALDMADDNNAEAIKMAFPEEWQKYLNIYELIHTKVGREI